MSDKFDRVEIGDKLYVFEMLPAETASTLMMSFINAFGGVIASLVPMLGCDSDDFDIFSLDVSAIKWPMVQAGIMGASANTDPAKMKPVVDVMIGSIFVNDISGGQGRRCTYDDFNGKIMTLYRVVFHALRYNYADFFVELLQSKESQEEKDV